ncbi:SagB/ThcOx family dehydrogenase [bacterium]|nr:SagB/ThcOx family dehydrogenase [bacterium]MBU1919392.1 SagB/ThcOx family dehydrogenase [bacterium]
MKQLLLLLLMTTSLSGFAQELPAIQLPEPIKTGGKPLMDCLAERHSTREYSKEALPLQTLSSLLWAAFGINREDGRRTAPTARNVQDMDIYAFLPDGVYHYNAAENRLEGVTAGDYRDRTGTQEFVGDAALNLVYVSDYSRMEIYDDATKPLWAHTHSGSIAQNVYLFCASEGLATVVRASIDKQHCAEVMNLKSEQHIILAQTVGYPVK